MRFWRYMPWVCLIGVLIAIAHTRLSSLPAGSSPNEEKEVLASSIASIRREEDLQRRFIFVPAEQLRIDQCCRLIAEQLKTPVRVVGYSKSSLFTHPIDLPEGQHHLCDLFNGSNGLTATVRDGIVTISDAKIEKVSCDMLSSEMSSFRFDGGLDDFWIYLCKAVDSRQLGLTLDMNLTDPTLKRGRFIAQNNKIVVTEPFGISNDFKLSVNIDHQTTPKEILDIVAKRYGIVYNYVLSLPNEGGEEPFPPVRIFFVHQNLNSESIPPRDKHIF